MLLMRDNRLAELFSFAPANDPDSQQMYIKYHSALAHNYILLVYFGHFLEENSSIEMVTSTVQEGRLYLYTLGSSTLGTRRL